MLQIRQNNHNRVNLYAKTHEYEKKKHRKKHKRGLSSPRGISLTDVDGETYVLAIRKDHSDTLFAPIPGLEASISAPDPSRDNHDISEFLDEWEIRQSVIYTISHYRYHISKYLYIYSKTQILIFSIQRY